MAHAATVYVWQESPSPAPPYTNWATAAHVIQDAVDAAAPGDTVLVTNGVYATGGRAVFGTMTNRVAVDKPLNLLSVNGPEATIIHGYQLPGAIIGSGAIRCMYLTNGASLSGFTLTKGATLSSGDVTNERSGGGVWCASSNVLVTGCIVISNSAFSGGGTYRGTLNDCVVRENSASLGGGASDSSLNRSQLIGNSAGYGGGGVYISLLNRCKLHGNSAYVGGGGAANATLNNCSLTGNSTEYGAGGGADQSVLNNCTVVGNTAVFTDAGGISSSTANNCVIFFNKGWNTPDGNYSHSSSPSPSILNHSCTTPMPTNGVGNITNAPLFVDTNGWSNLRLQSNSPCINAGNNAAVSGSTDLDGRPRIVVGTVDMGAYEFQGPGQSEFIGWLQQHALPTDGSADFTDTDTDGHNNWQEWKAWTVPTNALSVLKLLTPQPDANGVQVRWQSVSGQSYLLERGTNVGGSFTLLQSNLVGQAGTTSFTDTNISGGNSFLYRVAVPE